MSKQIPLKQIRISDKRIEVLNKMNIYCLKDLVLHFPYRYDSIEATALINNEKYVRYVSDGHRTKNGGFVKGRFMLQKSNKLANATYMPKRFKQMAIIIVKKG